MAYYRDVLGFMVLSPPYVMDGDAIRADMGEMLADPSMKAAGLADPGLTHVGLICDDLDETRKSLEDKGVRFLVDEIADIAGVRTTWFADPWGVVFILPRKRAHSLLGECPQSRRASPSVRTSRSLASPRLALIRLPFTVGQWLSAVCSSTSTASW